jgi:hypothetical protein
MHAFFLRWNHAESGSECGIEQDSIPCSPCPPAVSFLTLLLRLWDLYGWPKSKREKAANNCVEKGVQIFLHTQGSIILPSREIGSHAGKEAEIFADSKIPEQL